jgi:hypothetical protein
LVCFCGLAFFQQGGGLGLALKGFLWFGILGAVLGMAFTASAGAVYKAWELAAVFAAMPFLRALGVRILNKPFAPEKGVLPKIYFSQNRFEEWGGMLAMLLEFAVFLLLKRDAFALTLAGFGALGGAVGWVTGIWLMRVTMHPMKNGRYIFGALQTKGMINNWKIMEYTLGAVGALGAGAGFVLGFPALRPSISAIESAGGLWSPLEGLGGSMPAQILGFACLALLLAEPLIALLFESRFKNKGERMADITEQVVYTYLALPLVLLGAVDFSRMLSVLVLYYVLMTEMLFEKSQLPGAKNSLKFKLPLVLMGLGFAALEIYWRLAGESSQAVLAPFLLCLPVYYCAQLFLNDLLPRREKAKQEGTRLRPRHFGSLPVQEGFKLILMLIIGAAALALFR